MKKIKGVFALVLFVLLLVMPVTALAQDVGEADSPAQVEAGEVVQVEALSVGVEEQAAEALSIILGQVVDLTLLPFAVPLVVILVALVKRIPWGPVQRIPAGTIHLTFQVVIWVAYALFVKIGRGEDFQAWTEAAITMLQTLLPLVASLFGATWLYDKAKASTIPLLGYERDPFDVFANEGDLGKAIEAPAG